MLRLPAGSSNTRQFMKSWYTWGLTLRDLPRSTTIKCNLLIFVSGDLNSWKISAKATGGYAPRAVFRDLRRDWRNASSSGPSLREPSIRKTSAAWLLTCTPHTPAPYLRQPITVAALGNPRMSRGPMMMHSFWARVSATVARA